MKRTTKFKRWNVSNRGVFIDWTVPSIYFFYLKINLIYIKYEFYSRLLLDRCLNVVSYTMQIYTNVFMKSRVLIIEQHIIGTLLYHLDKLISDSGWHISLLNVPFWVGMLRHVLKGHLFFCVQLPPLALPYAHIYFVSADLPRFYTTAHSFMFPVP